jgi:hypothetical protein
VNISLDRQRVQSDQCREKEKRMQQNTKQKSSGGLVGTIPQIDEGTELGMGMLIAESDAGGYEPVCTVINIREGREIVAHNFRSRMADLQKGREPMCPCRYVVWAQDVEGAYRIVAEILPA